MISFDYRDKPPSDNQLIARWLYNPEDYFSKWFLIDENYKQPRLILVEYVYSDCYPRLNFYHSAATKPKYAPYVIDKKTLGILPDHWYELPDVVINKLFDECVKQPKLIRQKFPDWKPVEQTNQQIFGENLRDYYNGVEVLVHPSGHVLSNFNCSIKKEQIKYSWLLRTILPLCFAEKTSVFQILDTVL
jgi:hypothetical protein